MSAEALAKLIEIVEKATQIPLEPNQIHIANQFFEANRKYIDSETENQDLAELALEFIEKMGMSTEVKELEPKKIAIGSFMNISIPIKEKKMYISLDSRFAEFLEDRHEMKWNLESSLIDINSPASEKKNLAFVNTKPRNITYIRMYSFVIRRFTQTSERATVLLHEFDSQCMFMGNRKFHFVTLFNDLKYPINIFQRNASSSGIPLVDYTLHKRYELLSGYRFNEGIFRFDKPFSVLPSTLTISVGDPINKIKFYRHLFEKCTATFGTYETLGLMMVVTLPENHDMTTDFFFPYWNSIRSVFIDGFTTDNPAADADLIAWINGREHTVIYTDYSTPNNEMKIMLEVAGVPDTYTQLVGAFESYPDVPNIATLVAPVGVPSTFDVRINGERIIITLEMGFLDYA